MSHAFSYDLNKSRAGCWSHQLKLSFTWIFMYYTTTLGLQENVNSAGITVTDNRSREHFPRSFKFSVLNFQMVSLFQVGVQNSFVYTAPFWNLPDSSRCFPFFPLFRPSRTFSKLSLEEVPLDGIRRWVHEHRNIQHQGEILGYVSSGAV